MKRSLKTIADNPAADKLTAQNILLFRNDTLSYRIDPKARPPAGLYFYSLSENGIITQSLKMIVQ